MSIRQSRHPPRGPRVRRAQPSRTRQARQIASQEALRLSACSRNRDQACRQIGPPGRHPPLSSRIVQRAILEVLQQQETVRPYLESPTSFGGVPGAGVRPALEAALRAFNDGYIWYLKTDIVDFYRRVPREKALVQLLAGIDEAEFIKLVSLATIVELSNMEEIGTRATLFPSFDTGLGQGFCLSPLLGNTLLGPFDKALNGRGVICLRYIDDILLLGKRERHLKIAFQEARRLLKPLGLELYEPEKSDKARLARFETGLSYLGCDLCPGAIQPDRSSRQRFLRRIEATFANADVATRRTTSLRQQRCTVREVLERVDRLTMGWGNQYAYCNCPGILEEMDSKIDQMLSRYLRSVGMSVRSVGAERRRVLGVHLLVDSRSDPLVKPGWAAAA